MSATGKRLHENEEFLRLLDNGNLNDISLARMYNCSPAWVCMIRHKRSLNAVRLHQNGETRRAKITDEQVLNAVFMYDDIQEAADSIGYSRETVINRLYKMGVHLR